jgi:hypothetical protein
LRHHKVELGFVPVRYHFKAKGREKSLKFLPARQRFNITDRSSSEADRQKPVLQDG